MSFLSIFKREKELFFDKMMDMKSFYYLLDKLTDYEDQGYEVYLEIVILNDTYKYMEIYKYHRGTEVNTLGKCYTTNKKINNTTLLPMLYNVSFNPYFTAFLLPEQLHPKKWIDVVKKKQIRDEAINTQPYSDIYTCAKCHEKKFKISEIQLRCADEPTNKICQCMVCFHTFIK